MGANGSHANGSLESELGRNWKTTDTIGEIQVVQKKNAKESVKLPEESHTPTASTPSSTRKAMMYKP